MRPLLTKDGRAFCAAEIEDFPARSRSRSGPDVFEATRDLWTARHDSAARRTSSPSRRSAQRRSSARNGVLGRFESGAPGQGSARSRAGCPCRLSRGRRRGRPSGAAAAAAPARSQLIYRCSCGSRSTKQTDEAAIGAGCPKSSAAGRCARRRSTRLLLRTRSEDVGLQAPSINLTEALERRIARSSARMDS